MPIVTRVETDMFVFSDVADYMVNPVNLVSAPGAGLALEFRKRCPEFYEPYRAACQSQELRIGTVQVLDDLNTPWGIINFPTKRHYADTTHKDDLVRGLSALRDILLTEKYRYASIGMPMLGCGLGKQDYEVVHPLMVDHLGDLEATVFLSMSPARTELRPRYLVIVGPPDYGLKDNDKSKVDEIIDKATNHWGNQLSDYDGIVSGGYPGVDTYIAGSQFNKDIENTYVFKRTGKTPLVVQPNPERNGVASTMKHHHLLCEIGHDFIFFKPEGYNNNRMSFMQRWIKQDREKRENDGHEQRRTVVYGVTDTTLQQERMLV